ncbi:Sua5/YciO/YrdC/YwlC family protein [bacterium]|nr:Sua5/YciO/YrdC/YwlC family protein [bacterium]
MATESVAGLAALPASAAALARAKGRAKNPFAWVFATPSDLLAWWLPSALPPGGLEPLWGRSLTLVVPGEPKRPEVAPPLCSGPLGIGLRLGVPAALLELAGGTPFLLTSANLAGEAAPASLDSVGPALKAAAACRLEGPPGSGEPTSVVAWTKAGPLALRGPLPEVDW